MTISSQTGTARQPPADSGAAEVFCGPFALERLSNLRLSSRMQQVLEVSLEIAEGL